MTTADQFDLQRFLVAQAPVFSTVIAELQAGRKRSHWMWFIFPQLRGLGQSPTANFYGIGSLAEARAYLAHPLLGPRLAACTRTVLDLGKVSLRAVFGSPDDLKFHSSMSLFALAAPDPVSLFHRALGQWWNGAMDQRTVQLLEPGSDRG